MKLLAPLLLFMALSTAVTFAESAPSPVPSPSPIVVAPPSNGPMPPLAPSIVAVAEPAAPPAWAQDVMVSAEALPVVGPIIAKGMLYLGIISALLTSLVAFLLGVLKVLSGALSYAGLAKAADVIVAFQNGRFMYYLKFFSQFNAKAPAPDKAVS